MGGSRASSNQGGDALSVQQPDDSADAMLVQALVSQDVWGRLHAGSAAAAAAAAAGAAAAAVQPHTPVLQQDVSGAGDAHAVVAGPACGSFAAPTSQGATPLAVDGSFASWPEMWQQQQQQQQQAAVQPVAGAAAGDVPEGLAATMQALAAAQLRHRQLQMQQQQQPQAVVHFSEDELHMLQQLLLHSPQPQ
jgi:hypothetical protein